MQERNITLPVIEHIDLTVDGSSTVLEFSPKKDFKVIARMLWHLEYATATVVYTNFGAVAGGLTNGIQIKYAEEELLDAPIKQHQGFFEYAYDAQIVSDGSGTPNNVLTSRFSFFKFNRPMGGLFIDAKRTFKIQVRDDIDTTTLGGTLHAVLQGWKTN